MAARAGHARLHVAGGGQCHQHQCPRAARRIGRAQGPGYRPRQVLGLVLGEALLVGGGSGLLASVFTIGFFNLLYGGVPFEIAFFPVFRIPEISLAWGPAMGFATAFLGSCVPAWSASQVKVSEVFSKVA